MGVVTRIEGLRAAELPEALRERLGLDPDAVVTLSAERPRTPEEKLAAIKEIQERWAELPVLNEGTDDELVGYNDLGHFD